MMSGTMTDQPQSCCPLQQECSVALTPWTRRQRRRRRQRRQTRSRLGMLAVAILACVLQCNLTLVHAKKSKTHNPTEVPSASPTDTQRPSARPTIMPSASPTKRPTRMPSAQPSSSPTSKPSATPSATPSASPSRSPTSHPTAKPSTAPSPSPSSPPTSAPSSRPTSAPTLFPTKTPTTNEPTSRPTLKTLAPTASPVIGPTHAPVTTSPTATPPTFPPSSSPTASPISTSTTSPTLSPTKAQVVVGPPSTTEDSVTTTAAATTEATAETTVTEVATAAATVPAEEATTTATAATDPTSTETPRLQIVAVELPDLLFQLDLAPPEDGSTDTGDLDGVMDAFIEDVLSTNAAISQSFYSASLRVVVRDPMLIEALSLASLSQTNEPLQPEHEGGRRLQLGTTTSPTRVEIDGVAYFEADTDSTQITAIDTDSVPTVDELQQIFRSYFSFWGKTDLKLHLEKNDKKLKEVDDKAAIRVWIDGSEVVTDDDSDGDGDGDANKNLRSIDSNDGSGNNNAALRTSILAVIALAALVLVLASFVMYRRRKNNDKKAAAYAITAAPTRTTDFGSHDSDRDEKGHRGGSSPGHRSIDGRGYASSNDAMEIGSNCMMIGMDSSGAGSVPAKSLDSQSSCGLRTPERSNERRSVQSNPRPSPTFIDGLQGFGDLHEGGYVRTPNRLQHPMGIKDESTLLDSSIYTSGNSDLINLAQPYPLLGGTASSLSSSSSGYDAKRLDKVIAMARQTSYGSPQSSPIQFSPSPPRDGFDGPHPFPELQ